MQLLTTNEATTQTGLTHRQLKHLRLFGRLPYYRLGHRTVTYKPEDLHRTIERARAG